MNFREFFDKANPSRLPYPYQEELAKVEQFPELLSVPTGLGKTAAVVLGWLYRRRFHETQAIRKSTPRRLIYCFPMRVLVEQTFDVTQNWLTNLGLVDEVKVHLLMGGIDPAELKKQAAWDEHPEQDAILIGTQDMLLSRALNRGYGMSRYRWPMHFGLLNNDSLWAMDETQLMGVGLTTTAQLQGLRQKLGTYGGCRSLWMSATLDASPINTIDHPEPDGGFLCHKLTEQDFKQKSVQQRIGALKPIEKSKLTLSGESEKKNYAKELAVAIKSQHESQPGRLTLAVLNRVARAQEVFLELEKLCAKSKTEVELALIHARFRPHDRKHQEQRLFDKDQLTGPGRIVIATQAIEAGVDVSAAALYTELAPWSSLVQRFGRCNRGGEYSDAKVVWIDIQPKDDKDKVLLPYEHAALDLSREYLKSLKDVGPGSLAPLQKKYEDACQPPVVHTLRRKDLLDLWDTTPDLAGNDLDVSRFIRDSDDTDVQFYWRELDDAVPDSPLPAPQRSELCSVTIGRAKDFLTKLRKNKSQFACIWKPLDKQWQKLDPDDMRPGMVLLLRPEMGGYLDKIGWTGDPAHKPTPIPVDPTTPPDDGLEEDPGSEATSWMSLTDHLTLVTKSIEKMRDKKGSVEFPLPWSALVTAARWHDVGKSHAAFQNMLLNGHADAATRRETLWAKSGGYINGDAASFKRAEYWVDGPEGSNRREKRIGFRHELASALAWLQYRGTDPDADLIAFLIAAHHGKVRGSIRSLPNEEPPADPERLFARGVWHGDTLPEVDLGNGETVPITQLDLRLMNLGEGDYGRSWLARVLALRDDNENYGPFRLSFLETLLRVADWRGTEAGESP